MDLLQQIAANTEAGPYYESETDLPSVVTPDGLRLIAYYLPQFHPIPENDAWWGKGFTEWTNVTKALPRFAGHYQPHLPADLGFYDLRGADALRAQAALARRHGVAAFCFHHYWFGGRRLLQAPIENLLAAPDIDIGFCVNWANESWSRRWDGQAQSILMAQRHTPDDDIAFIDHLLPAFRDPRYIRIQGRPLLMLYRPLLLPDAQATLARWRRHCEQAGIPAPYVVMPQGFGDDDPRKYGMDAAAGFPPHAAIGPAPFDNPGWNDADITAGLDLLDPGYAGRVVEYGQMIDHALASDPSEFRLFPGVCPGWDNEARKPGRGACFHGATPRRYGAWLEQAARRALRAAEPDERIVFINAWNEWAEGAHLEPDRHFGHAFLLETRRALDRLAQQNAPLSAMALGGEAPQPRRQEPRPAGRSSLRRFARRLAFDVADRAEALAARLRG